MKNQEIDVVGRAPIICVRLTRENLAWIIIDTPHAFGTPVTAMAVEDNASRCARRRRSSPSIAGLSRREGSEG